ncbi:MAG: PfkB family carbohydrate kinase [Nanoarchaeota archaeon]
MIIENENINDKIKTLDDLESIVQNLKKEGKSVVLCHGVFDGGVHPGHIQYLSCARKQGDILIATVTKDEHVERGPGRPVIGEELRAESLGALQCVDYVAINPHRTAVEIIQRLRPDVYAKGEEFSKLQDETGKIKLEIDAIQSVGGKMYFTHGITFSSSSLINNNDSFTLYSKEARDFLKLFKTRYTSDYIHECLKDLASMRTVVVGESIIDEYHYCNSMGKSPKENIIPYQFLREERFGGGSVATANNIAGFCKEVELFSMFGSKSNEDNNFLIKNLRSNVTPHIVYADDRPTIKKRRGVDSVSYKKLFGQYFLNDTLIDTVLEEKIIEELKPVVKDSDLVVISDYGHGFITRRIVNFLSEQGRFLAVNAQTNSANTGFNTIHKYPKANYVCIDHAEARLAVQNRFQPLRTVCDEILRLGEYKKIAITEGHKGSLVYSSEEGYHSIPVFSQHIVDTMGAGDAYLSLTAPIVARNQPMDLVGFVGNAAGALAVTTIGNQTIHPGTLYKLITTLLK